MRIGLLRHGETTGGGGYIGRSDVPLSRRGWHQMERAVAAVDPPWQRIVASPLRRCAGFARHLARRRGLELRLEPRLMELDFGAWEGRRADEILDTDPRSLERFWEDPWRHPPPGGEPLSAFRSRVLEAWSTLLATPEGGTPLVITHGGVVRMILCHLERDEKAILAREVPLGSLHLLDTEKRPSPPSARGRPA